MRTRTLETKEVLRATVRRAEVLHARGASLLLKTVSQELGATGASHLLKTASQETAGKLASRDPRPEEVEGRIQIDVLADNVLRIRYAEGAEVPENRTAMVIGQLGGPSRCDIRIGTEQTGSAAGRGETSQSEGEVTITTAELSAVIHLRPYRIEIYDREGRRICGIGGWEKNHFGNWDSYNTGIVYPTSEAIPIAVESFDLAYDECIYGLGEQFIKLNKTGQTIDLDMMEALGVITPRSYKNVPIFISSGGYGVFFNHSSLMTCWVGSMSAVDVQVALEDDFLDYYVITGSIKQVLARYTDITGKGTLPPKWSFGFWQSKISYLSADETLEIARTMRERGIPCDVIHLDTHWFKEDWRCDLEFAPDRFPDPKHYFEEMAELGFKISLWQLPYIPEGSRLFEDLKAAGGFVRNADGEMYDCGFCLTPGFRGVVGVIDYTNPAAVRVHQEAFRRLFRLGARAIKVDFGESAPLDGVYYDGTPGHRMHNLYPLLYNRAMFEVTQDERGEGIIWARSAWAGSQRYPLHWGGDSSPNYPNMVPQLQGGLSLGLSGFQFWSQDIGGFMGVTNDRLLIRWMQFGMFNSHARIHGAGNREIFRFEPETERICRDYLRLRYRLLPYVFGSAIKCVEESLPMLRALVIEYQDDPNVRDMGDQYLFGDSLLVAPIFSEDGRRRVYLPGGVWTDWWSKERVAGPRWLDVEADIEKLPLYVREGAIIPMGPVMNYVDEFPVGEIDLHVSLFEGDGRSEFRVPVNAELVDVEYVASNGSHTLTIGESRVDFQAHTLGTGHIEVVRMGRD